MNRDIPQHPKYTLQRHYNRYRILRWRQVAAHWEGDEVAEFSDYETARQAFYDLMGWKYRPKNPKQQTHENTRL